MPLDANPVGKGYALWLTPGEPMFRCLARDISRLSRELATPRFEPHITLLSRIALQEEAVLAKSASLASILRPIRIELGEIGVLDDYFRCLFVTVTPCPAIGRAHQAACRVFACQRAPYIPHVSLVYGKLPTGTRKRIAAGLNSLPGKAFDVRKLTLYRVNGPVHHWKSIKTFDLK
jgi:2'-5' RNA ligase